MMHALTGAQLLAAWSMRLNISWGRLMLAMSFLAALVFAAGYLDQKGKTKK
jgi:hypothetical protein